MVFSIILTVQDIATHKMLTGIAVDYTILVAAGYGVFQHFLNRLEKK